MIAFRTMTYPINGCRGCDGRLQVERVAEVIYQADTDLVALQGVTAEALDAGLADLPQQLGMAAYGLTETTGLAILSRTPLRGYAAFDLGHGGRCLKVDYTLHDRRVHLFNFALSFHPYHRKNQLEALQGEELLCNPRLNCPLVVHGDISLPLPDPGHLDLSAHFKRARFPRWRSTFPARLPLWARSRIYLQGPITEITGRIPRGIARKASTSLPLIETLQLVDTRTTLFQPQRQSGRFRVASGEGAGCG